MNLSVELTSILTGAILIIFWLAGLSYASKRQTKDIDLLWEKHDSLGKELRNELSGISKALSRIEGRLSAEHNSDKR